MTETQPPDDDGRTIEIVERRLFEEFHQALPADELRNEAHLAVRRYKGAPVRNFVGILAFRHARETIRHRTAAP